MPKKNQDNDKVQDARRSNRLLWVCGIVVVLVALIIAHHLLPPQSVEEQLATIDAARAIPDSENAAVIYYQLATSGGRTGARPGYSDARDTFKFIRPWRGKDYPKVAAWLEDQQDVIGELLKASKFEKYRYKEFVEPGKVIMTSGAARAPRLYRFAARYGISDRWRDLLICALSNDIAEGRKAAAIEKHLCLMQMANHQRQDTDVIEYAEGVATEMMALLAMASFIVEADVAPEDLEIVETSVPPTTDNWKRDSATMTEVYRLNIKKFGYRDRLRHLWRDLTGKVLLDRMKDAYLTGLAARRGTHILIALRRHKNRTGHWPESLNEIRSSLTKEILTDPQNKGPFVYRQTNDGFTLYSKGKNKIDEMGKFSFIPGGGADDWPIWPPPVIETKVSGEGADPNESNPNTEPTE